MRYAGLAAAVVFLAATTALSTTIHVPGDQPTIQAGIDAAAAGDTVLVACGTYLETDLVLKSGIHLLAEQIDPPCVNVDADRSGGYFSATDVTDTAMRGIRFWNASTPSGSPTDIIRSSVSFENCGLLFMEATEGYGFAGCRIIESSPTFEGCSFYRNHVLPFAIQNSSPEFLDCEFSNNYVSESWRVSCVLVEERSSVLFEDCSFLWNTLYGASPERASLRPDRGWVTAACIYSSGSSTSIVCRGSEFHYNDGYSGVGAVYVSQGSASLTDCTFTSNRGNRGLAAVLDLEDGAVASIDQCRLMNSHCFDQCFVCDVGPGCTLSLSNSLFSGNRTPAIRVTGGNVDVSACTFASGEGGYLWLRSGAVVNVDRSLLTYSAFTPAHTVFDGTLKFSCSNLFGNTGGDWVGDIADQAHINGNISADPLYCNPNGDFTLHADSPCLPGNHPEGADCSLIGALGQGCGPVSIEELSWGRIKGMYQDGGR